MSDEASPRPLLYMCGSDVNAVFAANGALVARVEKAEDAALIVDAVNAIHETKKLSVKIYDPIRRAEAERDRLRDLVKRMIPFVEKCHSDALDLSKTIKGICALKGVDTSEIDRINSEHDALIAEARAAIWEDK